MTEKLTKEERKDRQKEHSERMNAYAKQLFVIKKGRIGRLDYFMISFCGNAFLRLVENLSEVLKIIDLSMFVAFPLLYLVACLMAKRFRDVGLSGWCALPLFCMNIGVGISVVAEVLSFDEDSRVLSLSVIGVVTFVNIFLIFWRGNKADNKYGSVPDFSAFGRNEPKKLT